MKKLKLFLLITSMLLLIIVTGCKKDETFEISGTWNISITILGQNYHDSIVLTGSDKTGIGNHSLFGEVGSYQIDGKDVAFTGQFQADSYTIFVSGSGVIVDDNNMNGTFTFYSSSYPDYKISGNWTAKKQ